MAATLLGVYLSVSLSVSVRLLLTLYFFHPNFSLYVSLNPQILWCDFIRAMFVFMFDYYVYILYNLEFYSQAWPIVIASNKPVNLCFKELPFTSCLPKIKGAITCLQISVSKSWQVPNKRWKCRLNYAYLNGMNWQELPASVSALAFDSFRRENGQR